MTGARVHQRPEVLGGRLRLRAANLRDDGRLANRRILAGQSEVRWGFAHIWAAADKIVYVSGLRARGRLHPRGLKPRRVNSISFQCSGSRTGNNSAAERGELDGA